ncbi:MAG TPA: hypothetical protein VGQ41_02910 [Pyrinomonadaceae bacterium]|jgi:hypothetical protein|nr:hypothetical protein [Pyrinomonadaceae bacterium]
MRVVSACFVVVVLLSVVVAQKQKPWTEWSKKDIDKTLNDSAWGQTQSEGGDQQSSSTSAITQVAAPRAAERDISRTGESGEAKPSTLVKYRVRFLSAKPVRAAFARMVLLSKSEPDPKLTDQLQKFIDRDFSDYIVVSVGLEVGDQKMAAPLMRIFTTATTEGLQKNVYLERKDGQKLYLMEYRAPIEDGMGAKFVFPRTVEGQPFLSENDSVRFVAQMNDKLKLNTRYKLSDMLYEGKLEY